MSVFESHGLFGILILIGLATGALTGLTGASGMSILISALLLAGIEIRDVIGLTFVITLVNAAIAVGSYWKHGHVDAKSGIFMAVPAIGAVPFGHAFSRSVDPNSLAGVMVVALFVIGVKFLVSPADREQSGLTQTRQPHPVMLVLMGCIAGFAMGIMGGGGALFIGVALILLFKMETKTAIGTSILIMGLAAIPGVVSNWFSGTIQVSYAVVIVGASIPAAFAASWYANRISKQLVKRLLGAYLVIISTLLLYRILS